MQLSQMQLSDTPPEIKQLIASYVDFPQGVNSRRVSTDFYATFTETSWVSKFTPKFIHERLTKDDKVSGFSRLLLIWIKNMGNHLSCLDLNHDVSNQTILEIAQTLKYKKIHSITSLDIHRDPFDEEISEWALSSLLASCHKLIKLNLSGRSELRSIDLQPENLKNIEDINLSGCIKLSTMTHLELVENCPKLKTLSAMYCDKFDNTVAVAIGKYSTQLRNLDISGCRKISNRGLKSLPHSLKTLQIANMKQVSNVGLLHILKNASLEKFIVEECGKIDSKVINAMLDRSDLTELRIDVQIDGQTIKKIASHKSLKELHFRFISLSNEDIEVLFKNKNLLSMTLDQCNMTEDIKEIKISSDISLSLLGKNHYRYIRV